MLSVLDQFIVTVVVVVVESILAYRLSCRCCKSFVVVEVVLDVFVVVQLIRLLFLN
jgi:hypothetical protein